jgi:gentisate 1,2-dioxygenase
MTEEQEFHDRIGAENLAALWVSRRGMDLTRPASTAEPTIWRFGDVRPHVIAAGDIVTTEDAFRRVLVLENPAYKGEMRATNTLYAGLQLVRPGEVAPCHRHSQTALRFVIEGTGAYTSVDGERIPLNQGGFVITPCWTWHDHGNEGDAPVIWMDVLDTPLVGFLDTVFRENYPEASFPITKPEGDTRARYGAGMLPADFDPALAPMPLTSHPYAEARKALDRLERSGDPDPWHGIKMQYTDPASGVPATPTMGAFLQRLPAGFKGAEYRSTESMILCVAEGQGQTMVDNQWIEWTRGDVFTLPGWRKHHHETNEGAVLFCVSERPVQQSLGLWREERGPAGA